MTRKVSKNSTEDLAVRVCVINFKNNIKLIGLALCINLSKWKWYVVEICLNMLFVKRFEVCILADTVFSTIRRQKYRFHLKGILYVYAVFLQVFCL